MKTLLVALSLLLLAGACSKTPEDPERTRRIVPDGIAIQPPALPQWTEPADGARSPERPARARPEPPVRWM